MNTRSLVAASALLLALSGCREDAVSPSGPESEPALATAATTPLAFTQVSGGLNHTCGVTTDNRIYCWGWNRFGTLGVGTNTGPEICMVGDDPCSTRPVAVVGELSFRQVSGGFGFTCGVTTDNQVSCWGLNSSGELGVGTNTGPETCGGPACSTRPVALLGGLKFRQVEVGEYHACGVSTKDRVYCWGQNTEGQLGVGTNTGPETCVGSPGATPSVPCSTRPVAILGGLKFRQLGAGLYHSCGVTTDDRVYCWGSNRYGQLGDSTEVLRRLRPSQVSGAHRFRQVAAGLLHTCAVTTGSRAFCWGNGRDGQLGNGKTYLSFWPRRVAGGLSIDRVTAGSHHTCGETSANRGYCWGLNSFGQLGDGTTTQRLTPVAVEGGLYFTQLSAGGFQTCGKTSAAVAYCWGWNDLGQLGDGTETNRLGPTQIAGAM